MYEEPAYQPAYDQPVYEEPAQEGPAYEEPVYQEPAEEENRDSYGMDDDFDEPEQPEGPVRQRKERKPKPAKAPKPPREPKPKKEKTGPSILDKFLAYYLAPLREEEAPQDPNSPRRRRKRTKAQLFKEVYLPPILAGVTLVLIIVFVIGSITNAIQQKKLDNEQAMRESQSQAEEEARKEEEAQSVLEEAERLAMGYDYDGAITVLQSYSGEMTQEMNEKVAEYVNTKSHLVEWKD